MTISPDCTGSVQAGFRWLRDLAIAEGNNIAVQELNNLKKMYNPHEAYLISEFDAPAQLVPRLKEVGMPSDWETTGLIFSSIPDYKLDNKFFAIVRKDYNYG